MTCSKYADVIERFRFGLKYVCNVVEQPLSELICFYGCFLRLGLEASLTRRHLQSACLNGQSDSRFWLHLRPDAVFYSIHFSPF